MPRYHFNIHDGVSLPDEVGTELRDLDAARDAAIRMTGELLKGSPHEFWSGTEWKLDVTDASGLILFTLMFMAMDAPSVSRSR